MSVFFTGLADVATVNDFAGATATAPVTLFGGAGGSTDVVSSEVDERDHSMVNR